MRIHHLALALGVLAVGACKDANAPDLNNPSVTDFSTITNLTQVQALATGVLRGDRGQATNEINFGETLGRDGYRVTASEPRTVTELLGPAIDPSDFLGGAIWPYANIRLANIGIDGINAAAAGVMSDAERNASVGFLQTLKALEYMRIIETRDSLGAPINVDIPPTGPLAPFSCKNDVLNYIASLLDSAATSLSQGGNSFPFVLPDGFAGFDAPPTFLMFNRGLAAKVDIYIAFRNYAASGTIDQVALTAAQTALTQSFVDTVNAANLNVGPLHTFSTSTGDATNGLFDTYIRANPRVVNEAYAGDARVPAAIDSGATAAVGGTAPPELVSSYWIYKIYPTPTSPVAILTNKELVLMLAEVEWGQGNLAGATALANFTRTHLGELPPFTVGTAGTVLDNILYEKRYSLLWQSADRWIDARLFGKLNGNDPPAGVGMERGYAPLGAFPIPFAESDARGGDVSQQCTSP